MNQELREFIDKQEFVEAGKSNAPQTGFVGPKTADYGAVKIFLVDLVGASPRQIGSLRK